jgi:hypothetical protein
MNSLFETWNYEVPHLPLIAHDLLSPITDYDNMVISQWKTGRNNPNYNYAAHDLLINTFGFYMSKGAAL